MALLTASKFGLPESLLARADELSQFFDSTNADSSISVIHRVSDIDTSQVNVRPNIDSSQINICELLESTAGAAAIKSAFIPPTYMPPPSFEGQSCVYILHLGDDSYYVGETDSLANRLSQHRSKGNDWKSASAVAIQVEGGKSYARELESEMIKSMARLGFHLVSITDGTSIRPRQN